MGSAEFQKRQEISAEAERAFAEFLARRSAGEAPDFDDLCARHPAAAADLRDLFADWQRLHAVIDRLSAPPESPSDLPASAPATEHGGGPVLRGGSRGGDATDTRSHISISRLEKIAAHMAPETRYTLKGEVARGAMGVVYRVYDEDLRRALAMKVVLGGREFLGEHEKVEIEPRKLSRFLEEAQITGQLDHPGVVPVHELGLDDHGRLYFTMRLVRGKDLRTIIDMVREGEEGWTLPRAVGVILRVCETVAFAHTKKVIHRDLKPSNIMIGRFGETYVMDWGLAKVMGGDDHHDIRLRDRADAASLSLVHTDRHDESATSPESPLVTMDGDVVGTPAYMPPEQARGSVADVDMRSDVYSVGAMLYHLITGERPYVGRSGRVSPHTVLAAVRTGPPTAVRALKPDVAPELEAICEKAMAREPEARYQDMLSMAEDLRAWLEGRVVHAYETGAWAEFKKWVLRNKGMAASIAGIALAVIAGLGSTTYVQAAGKKREKGLRVLEQQARELAQTQEMLALEAALREKDQRIVAQTLLAKNTRYADLGHMQKLGEGQNSLWPSVPGLVGDMDAWLEEARGVYGRLEDHQQTLASHRAKALPYSDEQRAADRARDPALFAAIDPAGDTVAFFEKELKNARKASADERAELEAQLAESRAKLEERELELLQSADRSWRFESLEDDREHVLLTALVAEMTAFDEVIASVAARREVAASREEVSLHGAEARERWARAVDDIARRPVYGGLRLVPHSGLLPLWVDSESGLWEFWHTLSGSRPERDLVHGGIRLEEAAGIVLVLVPGGEYWMGSSPSGGRNVDPDHDVNEGPVTRVALEPFFLSKYEMTQAQWRRCTLANPSMAEKKRGDEGNLLYPVDFVNRETAAEILPRFELRLPTEAQWEYACRAGTDMVFSTGATEATLEDHANVADIDFSNHYPDERGKPIVAFSDGYFGPAPIGSYLPNPWGFHDMHGNVGELCRDDYFPNLAVEFGPVDGLRQGPVDQGQLVRGGTWDFPAVFARSATRERVPPNQQHQALGLRPSCAVE